MMSRRFACTCPILRPSSLGQDPVRIVLDSLLQDPAWWLQQVTKAIKVFHADLAVWVERTQSGPAAHASVPPPPRPFACPLCSSTFELRKHLGVHLSRRHAVLAPTRHFAPTTFCLSCHKDYGSVARVQMHLKGSDACLRRVARLFPPMDPSDIADVEAAEKRSHKRVKACWQTFAAPQRRYASMARLSQHGRSEGRPRMPLKLTSGFPSSSRPTSLRPPLWNGGATHRGPVDRRAA